MVTELAAHGSLHDLIQAGVAVQKVRYVALYDRSSPLCARFTARFSAAISEHGERGRTLSPLQYAGLRESIMYDVAEGMAYLHGEVAGADGRPLDAPLRPGPPGRSCARKRPQCFPQ